MDPIRSIYEDDPDMLEIVREFVAELPERVAALERELEAGRLQEVQTLAHQLKGAGGGYGFAQVTEAAGALEQALKDEAGAGRIEDCCRTLCDTLRAVEVPEES